MNCYITTLKIDNEHYVFNSLTVRTVLSTKTNQSIKQIEEEIAEQLGQNDEDIPSTAYIHKILYGEKPIAAKHINAIIELYNIQIDELGTKIKPKEAIRGISLLHYLETMCPQDKKECEGYNTIVTFTKKRNELRSQMICELVMNERK